MRHNEHVCALVCVSVCALVSVNALLCACVSVCMCEYVCISVHVCACFLDQCVNQGQRQNTQH